MNVGSLFAGIGGFDLGFERAGLTTSWLCEQDPFCAGVLERRFPGRPIYPDVRTLDGTTVEPVEVLCGGFPCQDLSPPGKSVAGQNRPAGITGARSGLWSEFARLIGEIRPRFVVVENVPGLARYGLGTVLGDLASLGVTMRSGTVSPRPTSAHRTSASGSGLWPTPNARDWKDTGPSQGKRKSPNLGTAVHLFDPEVCWPHRPVRLADPVAARRPGTLNPAFVEWLMGFPVGWTE